MDAKFSIGETIPETDFVIEEHITTTAISSVYRVRSRSISRDFCAKVVSREDHKNRWQREVTALSELNNPHIVKMFRAVDHGDQVVIVLDWAAGRSLEDIVATDGVLHPAQIIELARQLSTALHSVHRAGLVHRDVQPSNIKIDILPNGDFFARLLDFGFAKRALDAHKTGLLGSPLYAAPEQISEEPLDARADIYQLGCSLFYGLTGEPPFPGQSVSGVMNAHMYQPPPRVSDHMSAVRRWGLDDLILRMLSKAPEHRPQTCEELLAELDRAGEFRAGDTKPLPPPPQAAHLSAVGPNRSVVTAQGSHISVVVDGVSTHFDVDHQEVSAIHPAIGSVYFGTKSGAISRLNVETASTSPIVQLPHFRSIVAITMMKDVILVTDAAGELFLIQADGTYSVLRCEPGQECGEPRDVAGAVDKYTFAVATADRTVAIFEGQKKPRCVGRRKIDFDVRQIAVSPDGYIVAVMGEDATWLLNGLNADVLHRLRPSNAANVSFSGGTLVGLDRDPEGSHKFFEIY